MPPGRNTFNVNLYDKGIIDFYLGLAQRNADDDAVGLPRARAGEKEGREAVKIEGHGRATVADIKAGRRGKINIYVSRNDINE